MKTNKEKTVVINGVSYEITNKRLYSYSNAKTLLQLYAKPSKAKQDAYKYRAGKLYEISALRGNCQCFTIFGVVKDNNGRLRNVKISKWHNYIEM